MMRSLYGEKIISFVIGKESARLGSKHGSDHKEYICIFGVFPNYRVYTISFLLYETIEFCNDSINRASSFSART